MDILTKIDSLAQRIAQEFNSVDSKTGDLSSLTTTNKDSLVNSIIELKSDLDSLSSENLINDSLSSSSNFVWSITKVKDYIDGIVDGLYTNVPVEHDTLKKMSDYILGIETNLGSYVSYNVETKTEPQKQQARENIDAVSSTELAAVQTQLDTLETDLGNLNYDFVADFNNEL
jgi:hypothetical protein